MIKFNKLIICLYLLPTLLLQSDIYAAYNRGGRTRYRPSVADRQAETNQDNSSYRRGGRSTPPAEVDACDNINDEIANLESLIKKKKNRIKELERKLEKLKRSRGKKGVVLGKDKKVFYDLGSGTGKVVFQTYFFDSANPENGQDFIEKNYSDIRADISDEERELVSKGKMGSPVYGEIKLKSLQTILEDPVLKIDKISKVVGVELAPTRYHHAKSIHEKLKNDGLELPGKILEFRNESMATTDLSDANYIYMCSTCFPDELMELITRRFSKLNDGLFVITLKSLPSIYEDCGFDKIKELTLPMTWSEGSPVYIYKLNKSKIKPECYKEKPVENSDDVD